MATRAESVWTCVMSRSRAGRLRRLFPTSQSGHVQGESQKGESPCQGRRRKFLTRSSDRRRRPSGPGRRRTTARSRPTAKAGGPNATGKSYGGVDVEGNTRDELYERAKKLGVKGASKMKKTELAEAIARKQ